MICPVFLFKYFYYTFCRLWIPFSQVINHVFRVFACAIWVCREFMFSLLYSLGFWSLKQTKSEFWEPARLVKVEDSQSRRVGGLRSVRFPRVFGIGFQQSIAEDATGKGWVRRLRRSLLVADFMLGGGDNIEASCNPRYNPEELCKETGAGVEAGHSSCCRGPRNQRCPLSWLIESGFISPPFPWRRGVIP